MCCSAWISDRTYENWYERRTLIYRTETEEIKRSKKLKETAQRVKFLEQRTCPSIWRGHAHKGAGIRNRYGLNGPGIEYRWEARFSAPVRPVRGPTCTMGTGSLYPWYSGRGVALSTQLDKLAPKLKKLYSYLATDTEVSGSIPGATRFSE